MFERLIIVFTIALAVVACWAILRVVQQRRMRTLATERPFDGIVPAGRPTIVAFSLPSCRECRTRQIPALNRLGAQLGDHVGVQTLSAADHPELVERLGLMTVPATAVLDAHGVLRFLNHGFADEQHLNQQLQTLAYTK